MLALTIYGKKQYIQIGEDVKIYVSRILPIKDSVSLAIDAPREIAIVRSSAKCRTKKVR